MKNKSLSIFILTCILSQGYAGILSWIWSKSNPRPDESPQHGHHQLGGEVSLNLMNKRVPFELKTVEEKFLASGTALIQLSELDSCQHKVIADLNTLCEHITEEQLAKLGVSLLNCQSKAEGRPTYVCTEEMTVSECTGPMDPNTWNAYHIVSNRARSVCYSVRQQQFQSKTEQTVNTLASSAENQLYIMKFLQEGQESLNGMAKETFETISESQGELMSQHDELKTSQTELHQNIEHNMKELTKEKALIASGHKELAEMTQAIRQQLDIATKQLFSQGDDHRQNHQQLLKDLLNIQNKAKLVWNRLDENMQHVTMYQDETSQYYQDAMDNMKKMNDTVIHLVNRVNDMQNGIDKQLTWLFDLLKSTGASLDVVSSCVKHTCYFLLAAIAVNFVYTPVFPRIVLLAIVPLNAMAEIGHMPCLDFISITVLLCITIILNWFVIWLYWFNDQNRQQEPKALHMFYPVKQSPEHLGAASIERLKFGSVDSTTDFYPNSDNSSLCDSTYVSNSTRILASSTDHSNADTTLSPNTPIMPILESTHMDNISRLPDTTPMPTGEELANSFGVINPARRHLGSAMDTVTPGTHNQKLIEATKRRNTMSPNRQPCTGVTKTGQPCKLTCPVGKSFCYRHSEQPLSRK
ncbi:protein brambleberry-like [Antedon mediterranea]|uniref:protein brambleberry-like n=1 Tax=Antedon mediterranea TaxID=105859 RepID=UPI003AF455C1